MPNVEVVEIRKNLMNYGKVVARISIEVKVGAVFVPSLNFQEIVQKKITVVERVAVFIILFLVTV